MSNSRKVKFNITPRYGKASGIHHDFEEDINNPHSNEGIEDYKQEMDLENMSLTYIEQYMK